MSSGTNKERITENNTKIDAIKTRALNLPSGISLENIGQLPAPITHLRSYRDNSGDLNLAWQNPADTSFSGKVVVVRKKDTYPSLPIYSQDYDIIENTNTIHYDKETIEPNQKYGFYVLPMNSQDYVQTLVTGANRLIDNSVDIKGGYVEVQLPEELQGQTALNSYMTKDGVVYLSSQSNSVPGVWRLDRTTNTVNKIYDSGYNWMVYNYVCEDNLGNVYMATNGTATGVLRYDITTGVCTKIISTSYPYYFFADSQNNVFMSNGSIIYRYDLGTDTVITVGSGYSEERYFYEDSYGNILLTPYSYTRGRPILKYDKTNDTFVTIASTTSTSTNGNFNSFFEDSQGNVFISVFGGSYPTYRYNRDTNTLVGVGIPSYHGTYASGDSSGYHPNNDSFFEDEEGNLFVIVQRDTNTTVNEFSWLYKYNRSTNQFESIATITLSGSIYNTMGTARKFFAYDNGLFVLRRYNNYDSARGVYRYDYTTGNVTKVASCPSYRL